MQVVNVPVYGESNGHCIGYARIDELVAQRIQALLPKMQQAPVVQVAPGVFDGSPWAPKTPVGATESREDRIRRLAKQCRFENSQSVVGALKQLENELEQENQRRTQSLLEEARKYKGELERHVWMLSDCAKARDALDKELMVVRNEAQAEHGKHVLMANELHRQIEGFQEALATSQTARNNETKVKLAALQRAEEYARERDVAQMNFAGLLRELTELKNQGIAGGVDVLKLVGTKCDELREALKRAQGRLESMNEYISARNLGQPAEEEFMRNEKIINAIKGVLK